jgi:hypothetical protein
MSFSYAQRRYSTLERELAALRWGVKSFRAFLYGVDFILRTDHQPLVYLQNMKLVDARLARTLEDLSDFSFTIEYIPGKMNIIADGLSRIPPDPIENPVSCDPSELPLGLVLEGTPVLGGGDSLFESVSRALERNIIGVGMVTAELLRRQAIDELLKDQKKYGFKTDTKNLKKELQRMRLPGQLPCLEVFIALSYLYDVTILAYFWSKVP